MSTVEQPSEPVEGCPVATDFDPFAHYRMDFFTRARREMPVFWDPTVEAYFLTRYADCHFVLKEQGSFTSAEPALNPNVQPIPEAMRILGESGFVPAPALVDEDGDVHRVHRQSTQPPFMAGRIKGLESFVRDQVSGRLDAITSQEEVDLIDDVVYDVPGATILHMMGVPDEELGMVKGFRGPWAVFQWGFPDEQVQIDTAHGMAQFGKWARELAQRALDQGGDDIVAEAAQNLLDKDAMDRLFLDAYTLNIVMAGHETTVNTTSGGVVALLEHPDQWQALVEDRSLIPNAVEEILRYATGVPTWRQRVIRDVSLSGVDLPAGAKVYVALNSANRDEDVFEDGDSFDIRRANAGKHLTFGTGVHTCMGNHLARLEMRVMLEEIIERLPNMQLVTGQDHGFSRNTSQRGPEHVRVRVHG